MVNLKVDPCPSNVSNSCWLSTSQSLTASLPSLPTARRLLSGEKASEWTPCKKPPKVAISLRLGQSHNFAKPNSQATAKSAPSGEKVAPTACFCSSFGSSSRPVEVSRNQLPPIKPTSTAHFSSGENSQTAGSTSTGPH